MLELYRTLHGYIHCSKNEALPWGDKGAYPMTLLNADQRQLVIFDTYIYHGRSLEGISLNAKS
jgi:hypothetical protein